MINLGANLLNAYELEKYLGDPRNPTNTISITSSMLSDLSEEFPYEQVAILDNWGLCRWFVPKQLGGNFISVANTSYLMRSVARRDLTLAIAYGKTYLGSVPVWLAGSPSMRASLADFVISGNPVCLALTERQHGADLLNIDTKAKFINDCYNISGEKWLINNATRAQRITLLAKDPDRSGPRSLSLFHFSKEDISDSFENLPKERTLGIRAADISGFKLVNAPVGKDAILGEAGDGFEIILKSLQLTRVSCCALSLGAGDHAIRLTLAYVRSRYIYNHFAVDISTVRRRISRAVLMVLIADAMANWAFKVADSSPEVLVTAAPVAKIMVPLLVQRAIEECGYVLGSRSYIIGSDITAPFQKIDRDHKLVALFDGSTTVNLQSLIVQMRSLASGFEKPCNLSRFLCKEPNANYGLGALRLMPSVREQDTIWSIYDPDISPELPADISKATKRLEAFTTAVHKDMKDRDNGAVPSGSKAFSIAWRYCLAYSAAAVVQAILEMPESLDLWGGPKWVNAAIDLLCNFHQSYYDSIDIDLMPQLIDCLDSGKLLSLTPLTVVDAL